MENEYLYKDFFYTIKKKFLLIIIGVIVGAIIPFFYNFNYSSVESNIHLNRVPASSQESSIIGYKNYIINLNDISRNVHIIIESDAMEKLGDSTTRSNISKNIKVVENAYNGNIKLEYKIKGENTQEATKVLNEISNKLVVFFGIGANENLLSYKMNGINNYKISNETRLAYSALGGIVGFGAAFGLAVFLEIIFKTNR
ncbi:MAG: hypothetical protein ACRC6T_00965 [Sarcina sp.]